MIDQRIKCLFQLNSFFYYSDTKLFYPPKMKSKTLPHLGLFWAFKFCNYTKVLHWFLKICNPCSFTLVITRRGTLLVADPPLMQLHNLVKSLKTLYRSLRFPSLGHLDKRAFQRCLKKGLSWWHNIIFTDSACLS